MSNNILGPYAGGMKGIAQLTVANAAVTSGYTLVGYAASGAGIMNIVNNLDQGVQISFDGVHDHLVVLKQTTLPLNLRTNFMALQASTPIYMKYLSAPSSGSIYFCFLGH